MKMINKQKNRSGSMLALVALGILAVGGIVPFLVENSETNQKLTNSIDETNKQIWALQSAVHNSMNNSNKNVLGLKETTEHCPETDPVNFNYGTDNQGFKSEAHVSEYNSHLNKNSAHLGHIHDTDGYDLSELQYNEVKPGVTVINRNTIYCWDKYGRLSKLENSRLVPVNVTINNQNKKVWQVVSDDHNNPIVLTTELKAVNLNDNNVYENSYYQFASRSDDFQAAIQNNDRLAIPGNNAAVNKFYEETAVNTKVEDLALSSNHGLVLVKSNDNWQVWGWGNNGKNQLICTDKDAEDKDKKTDYTELVKISDIFSQCKASGNVITDAVIPIQEFRRNDMSSAEEYFMQHYTYTQNPDGTYTITDISTGESGVHNHNIKQEKCNCPFCQDVFAPYTGYKFPPIQMHLPEDQVVERIECYINDDGTGNLKQPLQFQILDEAGETIIHTFMKSSLNKAAGQVFEPFEQILKNTWDADEIKKANLALKAGTYTIKILDNDGKEVHNMFLFYGWKNRPEDYKQNGAQELKDPDTFYGAIFTLNDNIYNLKGGDGKSKYGFDVNFYAVAAGENFSLAVVSPIPNPSDPDRTKDVASYSVIGWGNNTYGQIGCSKGINDENSKEEMTFIESAHLSSSVVEDYRDMQAGSNHALFLTKSGDVYSWGGSKDNASVYSVHKVNFNKDSNTKIVYISAGNEYSSAIDENGNIYAWSPDEGKSSNTINPISGINNSFFSIKQ